MYDKIVTPLSIDISTGDVITPAAAISDSKAILTRIAKSSDLIESWIKYRKKFPYAKNIAYEGIITILDELLSY